MNVKEFKQASKVDASKLSFPLALVESLTRRSTAMFDVRNTSPIQS